jgi:hypothetical protein
MAVRAMRPSASCDSSLVSACSDTRQMLLAHLLDEGELLRSAAAALDRDRHGAWSPQSVYKTMQRSTTFLHCKPHLQHI